MSQITKEIRAKAEIWHGDEKGQERIQFFLEQVEMPNGLLPLKDIVECGYVEETHFVWLKQKKKIEHKFEMIGRLVSYGTEISAYVDKHKIMKLNGVKVKELLIWINLSEIYAEDPKVEKITFKIPSGLHRTFPASAFWINGTKPIKEAEAVKKANEVKEAKEVREPEEKKEAKEMGEPEEVKEAKEMGEAGKVKEAIVVME